MNLLMRLFLWGLLILLALPAHAVEVTGFRAEAGENSEHISVRLTQKVPYKVFAVDNLPPRIVIDIPDAKWRGKAGLPAHYQPGLLRDLRFGFHDAHTGRIVLDLASVARPRNVSLIGSASEGGYWLEFDLVPEHMPKAHKSIFHFEAKPEPETKPVIVIDAGHGGQDPGTSGFAGTEEKRVTLRYAHALKDALQATGHYKVYLTREDDRYLFLHERVDKARADKGDLFISLHADSAPTREARGLSVYTISETASDKRSAQLAAKENKADVIGGMDLSDTSPDVANILIDLTQRETRSKSATFADLAIKNLGREVHLLSNTHRFAGFAVLKAPDIPSVLIEVGFLTTPREEAMLNSSGYEGKVVRALVRAVDGYFRKGR